MIKRKLVKDNMKKKFSCGEQLKNPFPADNFSKTKTKVIPNKECIILTHNLLKLYISNQIRFIFSSVLQDMKF